MRYGFYLPTRGPLAGRRDLSAILATAERAGFASTMVADHVILPTRIEFALSLHRRRQLRQRGGVPGAARLDVLRGGSHGKAAHRLERHDRAAQESGLQREGAGNDRCAVGRSSHGRHRRRLDGGGVQGAACRRFQAPRRGDRRVCRHLQEALDRRAGEPQRPLLQLRGGAVPAEAGPESAARRSGSAAIRSLRCGAWQGSATAGIPSARRPPRRCRPRRCARNSTRSRA